MTDKYNFYVFGTNKDYFKAMFSDVVNEQYVHYYDFQFTQKYPLWRVIAVFQRKKGKLGEKSFLSKTAFSSFMKNVRPNEGKNCFVFFGHSFSFLYFDLFNQLRALYSNCKIVFYFEDTIEYFSQQFPGLDLERLKKDCDLVMTYNRADARNYSLYFYPLFYPMSSSVVDSCYEKKHCVFFAGSNKNRLGKLLDAYVRLNTLGLKCLFYVNGVNESDQRPFIGVVYNHEINYKQILDFTMQSDCILELITPGLEGFTMRVLEAIAYNKILVTDNTFLKEVFPRDAPIVYLCDDLKPQIEKLFGSKVNWGEKKFSDKEFIGFLAKFLDEDNRPKVCTTLPVFLPLED